MYYNNIKLSDHLRIHSVVDILFGLERTIISPEETFPREEHQAVVNYLWMKWN